MRRKSAAVMLGIFLVLFTPCAWADGYPDQPPIKKSVRKVTVPRPPKKRKAKAAKVTPAPKPAPRPVVTALQQGVALAEQERYGAAQPLLRKAIMENRRSAAAWYWYGVCHEKTGRFYEAQYFYSKAVECDPNFEPLSRVVAWPNNGEKTPVWDPKRPAKVYSIPTEGNGVTVIPPNAPQAQRRPSRPQLDPELPKVPVYVPPEPGASPMDGDAWRPSVYVPPTMSEAKLETTEGDYPAYVPPASPKGYEALAPTTTANVPAYQPPASTQAVASSVQAPASAGYQAPQTAIYQPPSRSSAQPKTTVSETKPEPKPAAPRKIVKKSAKKTASQKSTKTTSTKKKNSAPAAKPQQPTAPTPSKAQPTPKPETDMPPVAPQQQPPRVEELPPVGQGMPEGTVEAPSMPPVGQEARS